MTDLERRLEEIYKGLKTTDDIPKLDEFMKESINIIAREYKIEEMLSIAKKLNDIHRKNKDIFLKAICRGNKVYRLREFTGSYKMRDYVIPREGEEFISEVLNSYMIGNDLETKIPTQYAIHCNMGVAISVNVIYDYLFMEE